MKKEEKNKKKLIIIISIVILLLIIVILGVLQYKNRNIESIKDSVVMLKTFDENGKLLSTGSGFCVYEDNYIATNYHVIQGAKSIKIVDDEKKEYDITKIEAFISSDDLAILSGDFSFTPIKVDNSNLKAGDNITTIGSPKGELNTVSTGIVSNADDEYRIRISAPISPGSSGGLLLNDKNKAIGITYAQYNSLEAQNINYAIKISYLDTLYEYVKNNEAFPFTSQIVSYSGLDSFVKEKTMNSHIYYYVDNINDFYEATSEKKLFESTLKSDDEGWYNEYIKLTDDEKNNCIEVLNSFQEQYQNNLNNSDNSNLKIINLSDFIKYYTTEEIAYNIAIEKYQYAIFISKVSSLNQNELINAIETLPVEEGQKILLKYCFVYKNIENFTDTENDTLIDYLFQKKYSDCASELLKKMGYRVELNGGKYNIYWN